ncbi:DUF1501 domain-containing protein [Schlesneria paludicola]|uniref:DUF1501 domain-containing protein n=1 Tax=Schlesneria paludicola TaxID=360056 RepID=UPI00029A4526|nr:DUF1501 domain-containing protein [Schlesneria paludicola]
MSSIGLNQIPRRTALQIGGMGLFGLTMPRLLHAGDLTDAKPARAKSVIFLYQFGGPSHLDTFDPKPNAPDGIRSHYGVIETTSPGIQICDRLPQTSLVMNDVTLVRTVHHNMKNHNPAAYYALTGHAPPLDDIRLRDTQDLFPAYGSVVDRLAPNVNGLPTFVAFPHVLRDGEITPGQHASFLGKGHDPLLVTSDPNDKRFSLPELSLPNDLTVERLQSRREIQKLVNRQIQQLEQSPAARGLNAYYERTLGMLNSSKVRDAFNLEAEPQSVRDRYGRTTYGQSCLLARRLVEAGVKFVNVYFSNTIGGRTNEGGWDTHGFDNTRMYPILSDYQLPLTEQTLPTLITDLKERGLFDDTLIVWMGEFGRTPRLNANISRDHWPQCYTALLAGGGAKRGHVHGASDKHGAYPDRDPVPLEDLMATVFELIGINPQTEVHDKLNRPLPISTGRPVTGIMA